MGEIKIKQSEKSDKIQFEISKLEGFNRKQDLQTQSDSSANLLSSIQGQLVSRIHKEKQKILPEGLPIVKSKENKEYQRDASVQCTLIDKATQMSTDNLDQNKSMDSIEYFQEKYKLREKAKTTFDNKNEFKANNLNWKTNLGSSQSKQNDDRNHNKRKCYEYNRTITNSSLLNNLSKFKTSFVKLNPEYRDFTKIKQVKANKKEAIRNRQNQNNLFQNRPLSCLHTISIIEKTPKKTKSGNQSNSKIDFFKYENQRTPNFKENKRYTFGKDSYFQDLDDQNRFTATQNMFDESNIQNGSDKEMISTNFNQYKRKGKNSLEFHNEYSDYRMIGTEEILDKYDIFTEKILDASHRYKENKILDNKFRSLSKNHELIKKKLANLQYCNLLT